MFDYEFNSHIFLKKFGEFILDSNFFSSNENLWEIPTFIDENEEGNPTVLTFPNKNELKLEFKTAIEALERIIFESIIRRPNVAIGNMEEFLTRGLSTFQRMIHSECKRQTIDQTKPGTSQVVVKTFILAALCLNTVFL